MRSTVQPSDMWKEHIADKRTFVTPKDTEVPHAEAIRIERKIRGRAKHFDVPEDVLYSVSSTELCVITL